MGPLAVGPFVPKAVTPEIVVLGPLPEGQLRGKHGEAVQYKAPPPAIAHLLPPPKPKGGAVTVWPPPPLPGKGVSTAALHGG